MKSLVDLLAALLHDCGRKSAAPVHRSVETLRMRVKHEGDSFITITLPDFCKDFERALDIGRIAPGSFRFFKRDDWELPRFLSEFLCNVFDSRGVLLTNPSMDCIRSIRQICLFGKKILRPCSHEREVAAVDEFCERDRELSFDCSSQLGRWYKAVARILIRNLGLDDEVREGFMSFHGPGATVERLRDNQKWVFRTWTDRLERVGFTYTKFGVASWFWLHELIMNGEPELLSPRNERPVRVTLVPKTQKSPRVIAVEPVCMQYAQQGLSRLLKRSLGRSQLTAGHLEFEDQSINQKMAKDASVSGKFATLDMSEASDRVSVSHVHELFASQPLYRDWVFAARSMVAELPSEELIPLRKFASMGSALCFPVEALVFFTSIIASRLHRAGLFPTHERVFSSGRDVYVYGDDLIVPADEAAAICDDLESLDFKVNRRKSFWTGKFRESCGLDCYGGEQVTPVYLRRDLPTSRTDTPGLLSAIATANQLETAGYSSTSAAIREAVEAHLGQLPQVPADSPALGWLHHSEMLPRHRWNKHLMRGEDLCWVAVSPKYPDPLDGDPALAKCFRMIGSKDAIDPDHLECSVRPYSLTLKRRWVATHNLGGIGVR